MKIYYKKSESTRFTSGWEIFAPGDLEGFMKNYPSTEYLLEVAEKKYTLTLVASCQERPFPIISPSEDDEAMKIQKETFPLASRGNLTLTENSDLEYFFKRHNYNPAYVEKGIEYYLEIGKMVFIVHAYEEKQVS